jgi:hypothetical protein
MCCRFFATTGFQQIPIRVVKHASSDIHYTLRRKIGRWLRRDLFQQHAAGLHLPLSP